MFAPPTLAVHTSRLESVYGQDRHIFVALPCNVFVALPCKYLSQWCALHLCAFDEKTAIFLATLSFFYITFVQNYSYRRRKSYSCFDYMRHIKAQYGHYFNFANRSNMPLYTLPVWAIEHFLRILH